MYGETKEDKKQEREGSDPDRNLPIEHYRELTVPQVASKAKKLSRQQLNTVEAYENTHKRRKGAIKALERAKQAKGDQAA